MFNQQGSRGAEAIFKAMTNERIHSCAPQGGA